MRTLGGGDYEIILHLFSSHRVFVWLLRLLYKTLKNKKVESLSNNSISINSKILFLEDLSPLICKQTEFIIVVDPISSINFP